MEKLDILEYLKHTPENTNPVILNQLITEYGEEHAPVGPGDNTEFIYFSYYEDEQHNGWIKSDKLAQEIIDLYSLGKNIVFTYDDELKQEGYGGGAAIERIDSAFDGSSTTIRTQINFYCFYSALEFAEKDWTVNTEDLNTPLKILGHSVE